MESNTQGDHPPGDMLENVEIASGFLTTLFGEQDKILFRPIETWTEEGKKRSSVDFHNTCYRLADPSQLKETLLQLFHKSAANRLNLFFGVCPRLGGDGKYDLAWQIRTVRSFWCDIDHATVDEVRARLKESSLPEPSIVVHSGNGVHLYWLLEQPYLIDDVGEPPAVQLEWQEGIKKPRKYIFQDQEKIYLEQRQKLPTLSPKAQHVQDILAGIANAVGGDHTTDLSRLLRIPGSLNRKDERSGRKPVPTALIECDAARKYSLTDFESFKRASAEENRAKKIASMPLPQPRRMSAGKADKLSELIAISELTEPGRRSEADFSVCCFAIQNGIHKDDVWRRVESVGKFAEEGERYFDRTWDKAEELVRAKTLEKLEFQAGFNRPTDGDGLNEEDVHLPGKPPEETYSTICVKTSYTPVAKTMSRITDLLLEVGGSYVRADQVVFVSGEEIIPILSSAELSGLLNQYVEFLFVEHKRYSYKPLPPNYGSTWLNHHGERSRLPAIDLFTRNPVYSHDWRLVAPGYDPKSKIFYAGPEVTSRRGTRHLDALLRDFCFKTPGDRTNYIGMLLTTVLTPHFIGSKPAVLFNGNQPGLGKTVLGQIISILRDGKAVETASYNANDEEFEKRLGSIVRRGATTIIVDNAKGKGRSPRIDSACLERSITDPILSFRLLGHSQDIRAENAHIFCLTANSPDVSRDLVTRSIVVNLFHEGNPERRTFSIDDPEGYAMEHRLEILGELIGMVEHWKASGKTLATTHSRFNKRGWGNVVGGILEANGEPDFLLNSEEAAVQLDDTHREFSDLVASLADHPQGMWAPKELVEHCDTNGFLSEELGDGSVRSKTTKLGMLAGRFVAERFELTDGRTATFIRSEDRKGNVYRVGIEEKVPNL
ncbi:hypothetical protein ACYFX5_01560 [Bremerella sp. T1]|uniref:hypothetical protein n=1 Tax=Bremerella sp. TYQ1 TaxID=3119568 RepID=UPI001CCE50FA|nr:hypothetical protein [Bremerella volcania]UBM36971.1 hypothetical protein LA756_03520 [Bremerella volcania]